MTLAPSPRLLRSAAVTALTLLAPFAVAAQDTAATGPFDPSDTPQEQEAPGRPVDTLRVAAPVVVRGDTVLFVSAPFGAFSAADRAAAIADRIRSISQDPPDSLSLLAADRVTDIIAADRVLMSVTEDDAAAVGMPRDSLALRYRDALFAELGRVSLTATVRALLLGSLWTAIATLVLVVLLRLVRRGVTRAEALVAAQQERGMPGVRIRTVELISPAIVTNFLYGAIRFVRLTMIVILLYFYLPLVLSFFPWTQRYADRLVSYITDPLMAVLRAVVGYLPNLFFIAVIVVVTQYGLKLVRLVFNAVGNGTLAIRSFERDWADPTYKIVRFLIIAFVAVVLFPYLPGADSDAFKGVSLFLGVLVSFGSSSAIANIVAGTVLTYTRAFNIGDRVQIGETTGDVIAKTLLVTRVRTIKNVDVTIPNAMVLGAHVQNFTAIARTRGLILHTGVTIGYDVPWRQVHELLINAAKATEAILADPAPFVLQTSLDDFYVAYQLNAYTSDASKMALTYSQLHQNIQDQFNAAGVEIMSPHYRALRDGNLVTIPAEHLPKDYVPPSFRVTRPEG